MSRSQLVILDANVIIYLHEINLWTHFLDRYDVIVSRVVADEAIFFEADGQRHDIDLNAASAAGKIQIVDVTTTELTAFSSRFDLLYFEALHAGELELLVYLSIHQDIDAAICSADKIVFRTLPHLGLAERGESLEELLAACGLGRTMPYMFTKSFREKWTRQGEQDWVRGLGTKRDDTDSRDR